MVGESPSEQTRALPVLRPPARASEYGSAHEGRPYVRQEWPRCVFPTPPADRGRAAAQGAVRLRVPSGGRSMTAALRSWALPLLVLVLAVLFLMVVATPHVAVKGALWLGLVRR